MSGESGGCESTYVVSGEVPPHTVTRSLQALLPTRDHPIRRQRFTLLDTVDGRVSRAGARLTQAGVNGQSLLSWKAGASLSELSVQLSQPVSFAWDLPEGPLYHAVAPVIGPRRLLPQAEAEESGLLLDILDSRGKTVARLRVESGQARLPTSRGAWRRLPTFVTLIGLRGYTKQYERLVPVLQSRPGVTACPEGVQTVIRQQIGAPEPRDVSSLRLDLARDVRADIGVRHVHRALLDIMLANQAGVQADLDTEFLHDFRVAVRRIRALLGQIRDVFGDEAVRYFSGEFSWVGRLTGPPRDLDVLILSLRERHRERPLDGLDAVVTLLEQTQRKEHASLVEGLRSDRFRALTEQWKAFLERPISLQPAERNARRRLTDVVFERAWQLSRKISRQVAVLDEATAPEAVHDLRVRAKKLRYLVDVTPASGNPADLKRVLAALKTLQGVLGDFNDAYVQERRLLECRRAMAATGVRAETLRAIGRLATQARERRNLLRADVVEHAQQFDRRTIRSACRRAFKRTDCEADCS